MFSSEIVKKICGASNGSKNEEVLLALLFGDTGIGGSVIVDRGQRKNPTIFYKHPPHLMQAYYLPIAFPSSVCPMAEYTRVFHSPPVLPSDYKLDLVSWKFALAYDPFSTRPSV